MNIRHQARLSIIGRIADEPKSGTTQSGAHYANVSVVREEPKKDSDEIMRQFYKISSYSDHNVKAIMALKKDNIIVAEGAHRSFSYEDKNGNQKWGTELVLTSLSCDYIAKMHSNGASVSTPSPKPKQVEYSDDIPF
jgi:single-stranded DNA-binding protein